ncbi:MAG: tRNA (adenosine(37)-N6)-threonylcarbamoyltransferase complex ATPase subunit type 1 TsaE [Parachlamydiaceae bacterium]
MKIVTSSTDETIGFSKQLASRIPRGSVLCFFGDLGAGKTTFIKGLIEGMVGCSPDAVNSPTFTYLNIYTGKNTVYHFDLYRLRDADEFLSMGFDEYMQDQDSFCCIEWPERISEYLPNNAIRITLRVLGDEQREIEIDGKLFV